MLETFLQFLFNGVKETQKITQAVAIALACLLKDPIAKDSKL